MQRSTRRIYALISITIFSILVAFFLPPIPQPIEYHNFADNRNLLGVNNFLNVFSNLAFILVGVLGFKEICFNAKNIFFKSPQEKYPYLVFFIGSIFVGFGSGYYHLDPNNITLFWDRLPMGIIIAAYFNAIFSERVSLKWGLRLLFPLLIISMSSVVYWECTELIMEGDLRFYGLMQSYPIVMVVLILIIFPSPYTRTKLIFKSLIWYGVAKVGEFSDHQVYNLTFHAISGHTIKHLAAAVAIYLTLSYLRQRKQLNYP